MTQPMQHQAAPAPLAEPAFLRLLPPGAKLAELASEDLSLLSAEIDTFCEAWLARVEARGEDLDADGFETLIKAQDEIAGLLAARMRGAADDGDALPTEPHPETEDEET